MAMKTGTQLETSLHALARTPGPTCSGLWGTAAGWPPDPRPAPQEAAAQQRETFNSSGQPPWARHRLTSHPGLLHRLENRSVLSYQLGEAWDNDRRGPEALTAQAPDPALPLPSWVATSVPRFPHLYNGKKVACLTRTPGVTEDKEWKCTSRTSASRGQSLQTGALGPGPPRAYFVWQNVCFLKKKFEFVAKVKKLRDFQ